MFTVTSTTPTALLVGVDTRKEVHAVVAISATGVRLAATAVLASSKGRATLEAWAKSMGPVQAFGVEGAGSYGVGLSRFLRERCYSVIEVNRPNRQLRHQKGKSDAVDAESAARAVLAGRAVGLSDSHTPAASSFRR
jgi:transposase